MVFRWVRKEKIESAYIWAIEHRSEHPLADAFLAHFDSDYDANEDEIALTRFESITGKGVQSEDKKGNRYALGSLSYLQDGFNNAEYQHTKQSRRSS